MDSAAIDITVANGYPGMSVSNLPQKIPASETIILLRKPSNLVMSKKLLLGF
jgi:hypothetical protein